MGDVDETQSVHDDDGGEEEEEEEESVIARLVPLDNAVAGPGEPKELVERPDGKGWVVGRGQSSDLVWAQDARLSREHCRLDVDASACSAKLTNLSGSNPTFVDGKRLNKGDHAALTTGSVVHLLNKAMPDGSSAIIGFTFELVGARAGPPSPITPVTKQTTPSKPHRSPHTPVGASKGGEGGKGDVHMQAGSGGDDKGKAGEERAEGKEEESDKKDGDDKKDGGNDGAKKAADAMEDNLTCMICHEIMHKCISLLPCLHNTCAACWSDCMKVDTRCPECRVSVTEVRRNHALASLVEAFLDANPDKRRDQAELDDMDKRNTIKDESLRISRKRRRDDDDYSDDGSDDEEEEEEEEVRCPECSVAGPDGFQCASDGSAQHVPCCVCFRPMPDRDNADGSLRRHQRCTSCRGVYCGMYLGNCPGFRLNPSGFMSSTNTSVGHELSLLSNLEVRRVPPNAFGGNDFEKKVLTNYINNHALTLTAVFQQTVAKIKSGEITDPKLVARFPPNVDDCVLCFRCAENAIQDVFYHFRVSITDKLPDAIRRRRPCWYGHECRTQKHNSQHAAKFNHICEPRPQP